MATAEKIMGPPWIGPGRDLMAVLCMPLVLYLNLNPISGPPEDKVDWEGSLDHFVLPSVAMSKDSFSSFHSYLFCLTVLLRTVADLSIVELPGHRL